MTNEDLNTELYMKMFSEQEQYKDWLLTLSPEEILKHAYEYTVREDILIKLEYDDISDAQAKALLKCESPLQEVFQKFEHLETDHMDTILECIENRANELIQAEAEALLSLPVYKKTASYAKEHGEKEQYTKSMQANIQCRTAVEDAIREHYHDNRLNPIGASNVLKQFGPERTCYVLAATVQDKDWDGRISDKNKAWAKGINIPQDITAWDTPSFRRFVCSNAHPGLIDLFVNQVRRELEPVVNRKPSVTERLKNEAVSTSPNSSAKSKDVSR